MSDTLIYYTNNSINEKKGSIITFHGGCFMGGDTSWDKDQNQMLRDLGYDVYQVAFPKNYKEFMEWAKKFKFNQMVHPIFCLGRSSGGYLAKCFFNLHQNTIQKVIYICPVFNPLLRANIKLAFKEKTDNFFGNSKDLVSTKDFDPERELIMLATDDENVPRNVFTQDQIDHALFLGPKTHCGMLKCTSETFSNYVLNFLQ